MEVECPAYELHHQLGEEVEAQRGRDTSIIQMGAEAGPQAAMVNLEKATAAERLPERSPRVTSFLQPFI